jgi:tetratricopeptide (TPR) repeat protein
MLEQDWEKALDFNTRAIDAGGTDPLVRFGPQFGTIFYRKGLCEMKLKRWDDAMRSFEICYRDFPNEADTAANPFEKMALLKWGEAAMGAEDWALAASCFNKFLGERDRNRDTFPQGAFYVNLAICKYRLGWIAEGNENLEIAIRNRANFPTPDVGIIAGFQALVSASLASHDEQALIDFIGKNRGELLIEPFAMARYTPVFMKLAGDALAAKLYRAALAIYQFVPSTDVAIDDTRARLKAMGGISEIADGTTEFSKAQLEQDLAALEAVRRENKAPETIKLAALAWMHESLGNPRAAFAAYQQLELYYPDSINREENLYHLIRISSRLGPVTGTRAYAETFINDFPESDKLDIVRRLLLVSIYESADYAACIQAALPMLQLLKPETVEHDCCLHILGVSYYQTGKHEEAQEMLDRHVEEYPASESALAAAFYQASNRMRLDPASDLLDQFLAKYPDASENPFLPVALYDRAANQLARAQPEAALGVITRILREFPDSGTFGRAFHLKGKAQEALNQLPEAAKSYREAIRIADSSDQHRLSDDALYSFMRLSNQPGAAIPPKEAAAYADTYWKDHAGDSPYRYDFAMAQVGPLTAAGREEDALGRLREMLVSADPQTAETMVRAYTSAYLKRHRPDELRTHFEKFPGVGDDKPFIRGLLRIAVINAYEELAKQPGEAVKAKAVIKELFQEFKTGFAIQDLSSELILRIGDHLRATTPTPREALPYYDEVIRRADPALHHASMLGRADVHSRSNAAADLDLALEDFTRVLSQSEHAAERDYASFRRIGLLMTQRKYKEASDFAGSYLSSGSGDYLGPVSLVLAQAFHQQDLPEKAVPLYEKLWTEHPMDLDLSAPAMAGWMLLSAHSPDARQEVYEKAVRYLSMTKNLAKESGGSAFAAWKEVEVLAMEIRPKTGN